MAAGEHSLRGTVLSQWRVAHAETGADMLREQFDRGTIADGIGLGKIFHGFDQRALPVHVTWIRGSLSLLAAYAGNDWNGKDFGHEKFTHCP